MTSPHPNGRADLGAAAERLSTAWDALATGHLVMSGDDEGLAVVARRLHASAIDVRERPGFRQDLRETIMHVPTTAAPIPWSLPDLERVS